MDIGQFLSAGKTYVHTAGGALARVAIPMLLALSVAVPSAGAAERVNNVTQMQRPSDMLSQVYQSLAAPHDKTLLIVSVVSPELVGVHKTMPKPLAELLAKRADAAGVSLEQAGAHEMSRLMGQDVESPFAHRLNGYTIFGGRQSICSVNAIEAVYSGVKQTRSGQLFAEHTPAGLEHVQPLGEALHDSTVHELGHCAMSKMFSGAGYEALGQGGALYGSAVDETLADLAVVLRYASVDGSFANGLASVKALRAASLGDIAHNTEDMLEYALEGINPAGLKGLSTHEIYQLVNQLAEALNPLGNEVLQGIFAKSALEKLEVGIKLFGTDQDVQEDYRTILEAFPVRRADLDLPARASKTIDAMVTGALRNPDLHRELGTFSLSDFQDMASTLGITLSASQIQRIAVVDGQLTPVGSPIRSPFEADQALQVRDYFSGLLRESGVPNMREALPDYSR